MASIRALSSGWSALEVVFRGWVTDLVADTRMTTKRNSTTKLLVCIATVFFSVVPLNAEYYKVNVSRIDKDLYRDNSSKTLIETRFCSEYATREDAVLKWEGRYGNNKLVFDSGTSCGVVALR
jgi:hypothetical protein